MYGPAPNRRRKSSFVRSRHGCESCRTKRRKCDQKKPSCCRCEQAGKDCVYAKASFRFHDASGWAAVKSRKARGGSCELGSDCLDHSIVPPNPICGPGGTFDDGTAYQGLFRSQDAKGLESHRDPHEARKTPDGLGIPWSRRNGQPPLTLTHQPQEPCPSADRLYANHFANHVTYILPPILRILCGSVMGAAITKHATMALGAANLAMLQNKSRTGLPDLPPLGDATHRVNALRHVGAALWLSGSCENKDLATVISTQLLLSFVEVEMGDLGGFESYLRSIELFLGNRAMEYSEELIYDTANLRQLAYPWDPRYSHLRDLRASQPSLDWSITNAVDSAQFRFAGSDAVELNFRIALLMAVQMNVDNPSKALKVMIHNYRPLGLHSVKDEEIAGCALQAATECQRARLRLQNLADHVKTCSPPPSLSSLPILNTYETSLLTLNNLCTIDSDGPIRFKSHDLAMDAADYVFARCLCDETSSFVVPGPKSLESLPTNWLRLLMRIAEGLDMKQCAQRNKYRRGIVSMLFYVNLFCSDARITLLIGRLTAELMAIGERWEDFNTPLEVIDLTTQVTRECQSQGFKIFMTSVRFSVKRPASAEGSQPILITLYGQEAAGRPLDFFLEMDPCHALSISPSHTSNLVELSQPKVLYSDAGNAWLKFEHHVEAQEPSVSSAVMTWTF